MRKKPPDPKKQLELAIKALGAQHYEAAESLANKIVERQPNWAPGMYVLGLVHYRQKRLDSAIAQLQWAIQADPEYTFAYNDLGNMLHECGRLQEAATILGRLCELQPESPTALNNLSVVLKDLGQIEKAVSVLRQAIALDAAYYSAHLNLGYCLEKMKFYDEAIMALETASQLGPDQAEPLRALANLYRQAGENELALSVYRRWQTIEPDNPVAQHMILALGSADVPERASDSYVREEFDRFADSFDQQLDRLDYQSPQQVAEKVASLVHNFARPLRILDAGCGTGKCGSLLRPLCDVLIGVDLSSGMLAHAEKLKVYDELHEAELIQFLSMSTNELEVVTIVDTLVYFGDLIPIFNGCQHLLRAGGYLVFTTESLKDPFPPFRLSPSGRYQHTRQYLIESLESCGFAWEALEEVVLRKEMGQPVRGYLCSARRIAYISSDIHAAAEGLHSID